MTIYVDEPVWPFRGKMYCHMFSDKGQNELHDFARLIGLRRQWFQDKQGFPHYDLAPSCRAMAIKRGAKPITNTEMVNLKRIANGQAVLP